MSQLDPEMLQLGLEDEKKKGKEFLICVCTDATSVWKLEIAVFLSVKPFNFHNTFASKLHIIIFH